MVKLLCGSHNHELTKSLVEHPYVGRLTKDEKTIIVNITKKHFTNVERVQCQWLYNNQTNIQCTW